MREKPHAARLWNGCRARSTTFGSRDGRPQKPFRYWLRGREKQFVPELLPLEPFNKSIGLSDPEVVYAWRVVGVEEPNADMRIGGIDRYAMIEFSSENDARAFTKRCALRALGGVHRGCRRKRCQGIKQ
jgi:hypothetical protein